jgi:hypothetical protein
LLIAGFTGENTMESELMTAAVTGLVASVVVIKIMSGPALFTVDLDGDENTGTGIDTGKPGEKHFAEVTQPDQSDASQVANASDQPQKVTLVNESRALRKLAPLKGVLGISDEQLSGAIKDTNQQIKNDPSVLDAADSISRTVDFVVLIAALLFGFYVLNVFSRGDLGRVVLGFFPAEMSSLKLAEYLRNFR